MRKVVDKKITFENSLTSTAIDKGLAAAQGKALEDGKEDKVAGKGLSTQDFTDADHSKLDGIEAGATTDQTDAQIATAYNNEVAQVSSSERTAGTETGIRRYSPADVKTITTTHSINALTGDVTAGVDGATTIGNNAVTLAKMSDMSTDTFIGRDTSGTGDPEHLSLATVKSMLSDVNNNSRIAYAKKFSNTTLKFYDAYSIELWWDSTQRQVKYKPTDGTWGYVDGSHLHVAGGTSTTASTTVTGFANDLSSSSGSFLYIANGGTADSTFNLNAYASVDRFTLITEGFSSTRPAFDGLVFIGATSHVCIFLREFFA